MPRYRTLNPQTASIAARLNRLPPLPAHRTATIIAGIGSFFDLFDIFLAGILSTVLTQQFQLSRLVLPAVIGSGFVGMFFGATLLGRFADRHGRRTAFLLNLGVYSVFTLIGAFSVNPTMLIASRFLAGLGIGAELPLVDTYLSELLPPDFRGRYTAWAYTIGFLGIPAAGFLGRVLVPIAPFGISGWRWMFVAGSLGAAIVWLLRAKLPESPRWLESVGRHADAELITARMEREAEAAGLLNSSHPQIPRSPHPHISRIFRDPHISRIFRDPDIPTSPHPKLSAIFTGPYRTRIIMLSVCHVFQAVGYYGFGTLVPSVLASKGYPIVTSLMFTSLTFVGYPVGSALSLPIIERIDRRWLIVGSTFLMSLFGLGLGFAVSPQAIVAMGFLYTVTSNIFSNALHVFQVEIFPTSVRATAAGTAYGMSRLSSGAMPFVLLPVLERWGAGAMFAVIAAALWIVMADIAWLAPSTTGQSLEQVSG